MDFFVCLFVCFCFVFGAYMVFCSCTYFFMYTCMWSALAILMCTMSQTHHDKLLRHQVHDYRSWVEHSHLFDSPLVVVQSHYTAPHSGEWAQCLYQSRKILQQLGDLQVERWVLCAWNFRGCCVQYSLITYSAGGTVGLWASRAENTYYHFSGASTCIQCTKTQHWRQVYTASLCDRSVCITQWWLM